MSTPDTFEESTITIRRQAMVIPDVGDAGRDAYEQRNRVLAKTVTIIRLINTCVEVNMTYEQLVAKVKNRFDAFVEDGTLSLVDYDTAKRICDENFKDVNPISENSEMFMKIVCEEALKAGELRHWDICAEYLKMADEMKWFTGQIKRSIRRATNPDTEEKGCDSSIEPCAD